MPLGQFENGYPHFGLHAIEIDLAPTPESLPTRLADSSNGIDPVIRLPNRVPGNRLGIRATSGK